MNQNNSDICAYSKDLKKLSPIELTKLSHDTGKKSKRLLAHVKTCESCARTIETGESMVRTGASLLSEVRAVEAFPEKEAGHVSEMDLAAFYDNGLTESETEKVKNHLGACHSCYHRYAALEKAMLAERDVDPERRATVEQAAEAQADSGTGAEGFEYLRGAWKKFTGFFLDTFSSRAPVWGASLAALVLAAATVYFLIHPFETKEILVAIPETVSSDGRVMSGVKPDDIQPAVVSLSGSENATLRFVWPESDGEVKYEVKIYDDRDSLVGVHVSVDKNYISLPNSRFNPGRIYSLWIYAKFEKGAALRNRFSFILNHGNGRLPATD